MTQQSNSINFEEAVLPHLDAAYNLARWLTRNAQDAEDVAQEAYLRAFRFFDGYQGGNMRSWLLAIVRNTSYSWLHQNRAHHPTTAFDEELHTDVTDSQSPETLLLRNADRQLLKQALEELPLVFRGGLQSCRSWKELSYNEIASVLGRPHRYRNVQIGPCPMQASRIRDSPPCRRTSIRPIEGSPGQAGPTNRKTGYQAAENFHQSQFLKMANARNRPCDKPCVGASLCATNGERPPQRWRKPSQFPG